MPGKSVEVQIPVFVFPNSLTFYIDNEATHKQIITLYNPYKFEVHYEILSTAPEKYLIIDSCGSLSPSNSIDIVIRHLAPVARNVGHSDRIRVQLLIRAHSQILGKKDVEVTLRECHSADSKLDENVSHQTSSSTDTIEYVTKVEDSEHANVKKDQYLGRLFALLGILSMPLFLPTRYDESATVVESSGILSDFQVPIAVQLSCAFAVGIVTTLIVQRFS